MTVTVRLTEKEYAFLNYYQGTAIKAYLNDFIKNDFVQWSLIVEEKFVGV